MHYALQAVAALQSAKTIRDLEESLLQARGLVGIEEDVADARARLSAMTEAIVIPYLPLCLFWHDALLPPRPNMKAIPESASTLTSILAELRAITITPQIDVATCCIPRVTFDQTWQVQSLSLCNPNIEANL